jgi:hypothetical protein
MTARRREADRQREERRRTISESFARRHPARAADERALRKAQAAAVEHHAKRPSWREGTAETHAQAAATRQGTLARLFEKGRLTIHQLAAAERIRQVHGRLTGDVAIGTVSFETRVDNSSHGAEFFEALGAVRAEIAYGRWRTAMAGRLPLMLALVIEERSVSDAARQARVRPETALKQLSFALDLWDELTGEACRAVDDEDLEAAHRRLL